MKAFAQKILGKLATVIVALLLYGVIVILNTPRNARAATVDFIPPASAMALSDSTAAPGAAIHDQLATQVVGIA